MQLGVFVKITEIATVVNKVQSNLDSLMPDLM